MAREAASNRRLVAALEEVFARCADRPSIVAEDAHPRCVITFGQLAARVARVASALRRRDFKPGDILPIWADRSPDSVAVALAAIFGGGGFCWLNDLYPTATRRRVLALLGARWLAVGDSRREQWATGEDLGAPLERLDPSCEPDVETLWVETLLGSDSSRETKGAACVLFTSGSTGAPKGVLIA